MLSEDSVFAVRGAWSPLLRVWWLRLWRPNPLLRPLDRIEAVLRIIVVVAVLVAIPVAGTLGTTAYTGAAARIRTENAAKSAVSAVITEEPQLMSSHLLEARVQWLRDGRPGTATVRVRGSAAIGDHVTVWLGPEGAPTGPPQPSNVAAMTGIGVGVVVLSGTWVVAWLLLQGTVWLLERRRRMQWDQQWRNLNRPITEDRQ